ncbi:hypothetical protein RJT34_09488 [Clitoria ternatea]|uniref:Uncharacterized protein n=1 Tax=Clitoria ternatea TaxID=43366 RepID=A0AAN9K8W1_CLITE
MAPPSVRIEPEYCPQAVIDWYDFTGSSKYLWRQGEKSGLCLKAKKHLLQLGWEFWYIDKKGRRELRYTSPNNGKNYISLRRACAGCIQDGVYGNEPQNVPFVQENNFQQYPSTTFVSSPPKKIKKQAAKCKKKRVQLKRFKRRQKDESSDDHDWTPEDHKELEEGKATKSRCKKETRVQSKRFKKRRNEKWGLEDHQGEAYGKRGKVLRSTKRVRDEDETKTQENPRTIVSWLIDKQVVALGTRVFTLDANNEVAREGKLLHAGIVCDCCDEVLSLAEFKAHAGRTKHGGPSSSSIFLKNGRSLLFYQKEALYLMTEEDTESIVFQGGNDSICSVCKDGGDIVLCDGCPSSFHLGCVGLDHAPDDDWFRPSCCCRVCERHGYVEDDADSVDKKFVGCDQCECKYHIGCLKARGFTSWGNHPNEKNWFCSRSCKKIFSGLHALIGKPVIVGEDNLSWTWLKALQGEDYRYDSSYWIQNESMLHVALGVLHDCFDPVIDGFFHRDIVRDVIFNRSSKLNRLNFGGFYTLILERNEEVISVATIRIFGKKVAEIPFVATGRKFRRQGMCSILMNEIEKQLRLLRVKKIVLPSCGNVIDTWSNSFGFSRMTNSDKLRFLDYTFLDFHDTIMCHKSLVKPSMDHDVA